MYGQAQGSGMNASAELNRQWAPPTGMSEPNVATAVGSATEQVAVANKRLAELTGRARSIADAAFGTGQPQSGGLLSAKEAPGGGGRFSQLTTETRTLHQIIDDLSTQIDRLTCL